MNLAIQAMSGAARAKISTASQYIKSNAMRGAVGALGVAGIAISGYAGYHSNKEEYGAGGAIGLALGEAAMFAAFPVAGTIGGISYMAGSAAVDFGRNQYTQNRKANFGSPQQDVFGHSATMRQRSAFNIDRGRASVGQEARLFHY
jgi:hypothetical protein